MGSRGLALPILLLAAARVHPQTTCPATPVYSVCDIVFELNEAEAVAHPNPYASVDIHAEFRSPRHRTFLMPAFWDGGRRMVIRFTPNEAGAWDYRVSGNIQRFSGATGNLTASVSESPGFVRPANVHHFAYTEENKPHLWMGDTCYRFAFLDRALFEKIVDTRAAQKFNHLRGAVLGSPDDARKIFPKPDQIEPAHFRTLDERILYLNRKGIVADLILGGPGNQLTDLLPNWQDRERYIRYLASRYSPLNITWQGLADFESYENGRALLKEIGGLLKKCDPYQHPRSTGSLATSAPLLDDGWMDYIVYQSSDDQLGSVEHQLYPAPFVNAGFACEDSGAGKSGREDVDTDTFRHRLWNAAMDGQYVTFCNTGTSGMGKIPVDARFLDSPAARQMTVWFDFFAATRHWDNEPYFDVDGGRALALETVEYVIYAEKPGPVEALVEKHGYDVAWFNPIGGELLKQKKEFKGEKFTGDPPDTTHDWVLHIFRGGKMESMLKSYKFEARPVIMQEVEQDTQKVPFEVELPSADTLPVSKPIPFRAKLKRETRASRQMKWLWTGEVAADGQGYRLLGTGEKGTFIIPPGIAKRYPAVMSLRLVGLNGVGKVYSLDKVDTISQSAPLQ